MDSNDIQRPLRLLDYDSHEIRVIHPNRTSIPSQLIHSFAELFALCQKHDGLSNIYVGINERNKTNATKQDIHAVNFVIIDLDSIRPDKNQPANQLELDATIQASKVIMNWFADNGFLPPVRAISGNGCHIWVRIPQLPLAGLEMTTEWESRVKQFYLQIQSVLPTGLQQKVKIDPIQDVTRIIKLIGTTSVKNNPTDDRPNRVSSWLDDPESLVIDAKLFQYLQSLSPAITINSAPTVDFESRHIASIKPYHKIILDRAMSSFHIQQTRRNLTGTDRSASDFALLNELAKEGILDAQILKYALMTTSATKYQRDGNQSYVDHTVDKFIRGISNLSENHYWFQQAQDKLKAEFDAINLEQQEIIVCQAPVGIGKTHNAISKVEQSVADGIDVLIAVPTHALAEEWKSKLNLDSSKSIVRLHGITSPEVNCPKLKDGKKLLLKGHSTLFRKKYCSSCSLKESCKYYDSLEVAEDVNVLIVQHRHLNLFPMFLRNQHGNQRRRLVIIDEMPELVNVVRINLVDLEQNLQLMEKMLDANVEDSLVLVEALTQFQVAHHNRSDLELEDHLVQELRKVNFQQLNQVIADQYLERGDIPPFKNLLWDLMNVGILKCKLKYLKDEDVLTYSWKLNFNHKTVLILSGTLKSKYVQQQLGQPVVGISQDWTIIRKNLKVVQLIAGMGGRNTLKKEIEDGEFSHKHGRLFQLILEKHQGQAIALVTSLGGNGAFKSMIHQQLESISSSYGIQLSSIDDVLKQQIPDGIEDIPLFHWGMKGLDKLKGKFEVIWEVNGHYYPPRAIKKAVRDKFGIEEKEIEDPEIRYQPFTDFFNQQIYKTQTHVWHHPLAQMEVEQTQRADMEQTGGRFYREDEIHKTIYRTHNVQYQPYPTRIYKSWKMMIGQEFYGFINPLELLTPTERSLVDWIEQRGKGREFTVNQANQDLETIKGEKMKKPNLRQYLNRLTGLGILESWSSKGKNYYRQVV